MPYRTFVESMFQLTSTWVEEDKAESKSAAHAFRPLLDSCRTLDEKYSRFLSFVYSAVVTPEGTLKELDVPSTTAVGRKEKKEKRRRKKQTQKDAGSDRNVYVKSAIAGADGKMVVSLYRSASTIHQQEIDAALQDPNRQHREMETITEASLSEQSEKKTGQAEQARHHAMTRSATAVQLKSTIPPESLTIHQQEIDAALQDPNRQHKAMEMKMITEASEQSEKKTGQAEQARHHAMTRSATAVQLKSTIPTEPDIGHTVLASWSQPPHPMSSQEQVQLQATQAQALVMNSGNEQLPGGGYDNEMAMAAVSSQARESVNSHQRESPPSVPPCNCRQKVTLDEIEQVWQRDPDRYNSTDATGPTGLSESAEPYLLNHHRQFNDFLRVKKSQRPSSALFSHGSSRSNGSKSGSRLTRDSSNGWTPRRLGEPRSALQIRYNLGWITPQKPGPEQAAHNAHRSPVPPATARSPRERNHRPAQRPEQVQCQQEQSGGGERHPEMAMALDFTASSTIRLRELTIPTPSAMPARTRAGAAVVRTDPTIKSAVGLAGFVDGEPQWEMKQPRNGDRFA
jgi:hypothetical protein